MKLNQKYQFSRLLFLILTFVLFNFALADINETSNTCITNNCLSQTPYDNLGSWVELGSSNTISDSQITNTSLAIAPDGTQYIAYIDNHKAFVKKFNGIYWESVGNISSSYALLSNTSLAIDSSGTPYLAFLDASSSAATIIKFNGVAWETVGDKTSLKPDAMNISLAIDESDTLYIAYVADTNVTVMRLTKPNEIWEDLYNPEISSNPRISNISLVVDKTQTLYLAFTGSSSDSNRVKVMKYEINGFKWWNTLGHDYVSYEPADFLSLALDPTGIPYLAYANILDNNVAELNVMKYNGKYWDSIGPKFFINIISANLAINSNGNIYVAYSDNTNMNKATVIKFNGNIWESMGNNGVVSNDHAASTNLALDANNIPYVAYINTDHIPPPGFPVINGTYKVMKFTTN